MITKMWAAVERTIGIKWARYGAISAFTLTLTQALLFVLVVAGVNEVVANVISVSTAAIPGFLLNRQWAFEVTDQHRPGAEMLPFAVITMFSLVWSSVIVGIAGALIEGVWVPNAAQFVAFLSSWVVKFFVLDRVLFSRPSTNSDV